MKKGVILLLALVCVSAVNAQLFEIRGVSFGYLYLGPKLGLTMASQTNTLGPNENKAINYGGQIGAVARLGITKKIAIQPEFIYSSKGYGASDDLFNTEKRTNYRYIGLPVVLKYAILTIKGIDLDAEGGFYSEVLTGVESVTEFENGDTEKHSHSSLEQFKKVDFGFSVGASATKTISTGDRISIDLRYSRGVVDVVKIVSEKQINSNFQVAVTYLF
jgi:hypothetical protein